MVKIAASKIIFLYFSFSKEGSPIFVDSSGDVFLWHRKNSFWVPIANTRQQVKNFFSFKFI